MMMGNMNSGVYVLADRITVPDNTKMSLRSRHGNIQSAFLAEETDLLFGVAAHCTDNYCFLLSALEAVNGAEFELRVLLFQEASKQSQLWRRTVSAVLVRSGIVR